VSKLKSDDQVIQISPQADNSDSTSQYMIYGLTANGALVKYSFVEGEWQYV
jgi:hypothetical protein